MNTKDKSKLNGKDLISIGIFTAVYFILNLLIAAAMGFIPLVNMMIPFASSLVLGIPMMLYFSKIKKFGMVLITYIIYGAILTLAGVGIYSLIFIHSSTHLVYVDDKGKALYTSTLPPLLHLFFLQIILIKRIFY